jgi:hypothetical protein
VWERAVGGRFHGELGVAGHFFALIPGYAVAQELRQRLHFFGQECGHAIGASVVWNSHALIRELIAAAELGGRSRRLGDGTERARKTVTAGTDCAYTSTEPPGS